MPTVGCLSNYAERAILEHVFNKVSLAVPYLYVGLCTADPGEAGTGAACNEVPNTNFYERAAAYYWSSAVGGLVENTAAIVFHEATPGGWGPVTHFAFLDSLTYGTGEMFVYGVLAVPRIVVAGSIPRFEIGEFVITMD